MLSYNQKNDMINQTSQNPERGKSTPIQLFRGSYWRPSLSYTVAISPNSEGQVRRAFDILFQEVMRRRRSSNHK